MRHRFVGVLLAIPSGISFLASAENIVVAQTGADEGCCIVKPYGGLKMTWIYNDDWTRDDCQQLSLEGVAEVTFLPQVKCEEPKKK